jgi:ABC-type sugar transport system substrate-binding protein
MDRLRGRVARRDVLRWGLAGSGLLALAGCGGGSGPGPGAQGSGAAAGTGPGGKRLRIAAVGMQDDQFFKLVEMGIRDAAKKADVELLLGNSTGSTEKEASLVEAYVTQKLDALLIAPVSPKASIPALKGAHDAGIKVITYDSAVEADFPVANIKSDQTALGKATGTEAKSYIEKKLGGKAKIAVVSYRALLPEPASQRNDGFLSQVKELPGVEIAATQDAWMADKAVTVVDDILTRTPEIQLIWAANEGGTVGAVNAVRNAGKAGKIAVFGTDISEQIAEFLLASDDVLQAVTGQKPFEIGTQALETAVKAVKGEGVERQTLLPGQLFSRTKPEEVTKYRDYLRSLPKA